MAVVIEVQPLDGDAFTRFGWLPVSEGDERDERQELAFAWADAHLNYISHGPDEIVRVPEGAVIERLYRHDTHTQALMPINTDAVLVVAPPSADFATEGELRTMRGFLLRPLDVVVLRRGTWHWGPFPVGAEPVRLLNLQGRRYREDNTSVEPGAALGVQVVVPMPTAD